LSNTIIAELHNVLISERQALISAKFDVLPVLLSRKENCLARLANLDPNKVALRMVKDSMDENQALLAAAIKGVAAAGERLEALQKVQNGLSVYTDEGRVELAQRHTRTLEKKA
jgi:flagellar biosynthesis/type III secretory pathway chaperone